MEIDNVIFSIWSPTWKEIANGMGPLCDVIKNIILKCTYIQIHSLVEFYEKSVRGHEHVFDKDESTPPGFTGCVRSHRGLLTEYAAGCVNAFTASEVVSWCTFIFIKKLFVPAKTFFVEFY